MKGGIKVAIIFSIISIFIMYKCCERFEFKVTWVIYFVITLLKLIISNGFSWLMVISAVIASTIMVVLYYKAYAKSDYSFGKFFLWAFIYELIITLLTVVIFVAFGTMFATVNSNVGILSGAN
jgi:hypothetical protein